MKSPENLIKSEISGLLHVARHGGLEPSAYWFVASHSIQLS